MYWPIKHIHWAWPGKKKCRAVVRVFVCTHTRMHGFVRLLMCVLSVGWDSVLMKDSRAIE